MILSMTGYGKGSAQNKNWQADVEAKSINSRYLEIFLKFPQQLTNKEFELKELIKSKIGRGKLNVIVQLKHNGAQSESIILDESKLKNYITLINKVKKSAKINEKIKIEHLLSSREIFTPASEELNDEDFELVKSAVSSAIESLLTMKKNEGNELEKDIINRIKSIEKNIADIEQESASAGNEHFTRYRERINNLLVENTVVNKDRLETEIAILAERADITEECVRLKSHIKLFLNSIGKEQDPGRKLNFICQEMNREANTISAKTLSTTITHKTVYIREEIERIREQIQNIE